MTGELFSSFVRRLVLAFLLITVIALATGAHAQNAGNTGTDTVSFKVFSSQAASGSSGGFWSPCVLAGATTPCSVFRNIGQSSHYLTYCGTGFGGSIDIEVAYDPVAGPWIPIASATYGQNSVLYTGCNVLQGGGYFQNVRSTVSNVSAGSISAQYSASSGPIAFAASALNSNGATSPVACDKTVYQFFAPSASLFLIGGTPGTRIYICQATVSFNGATTSGTFGLEEVTLGTGCTSPVPFWLAEVTSSTPQTYQVGGPLGAFASTFTPGHAVCVVTTAIGANVLLAVSYAQF